MNKALRIALPIAGGLALCAAAAVFLTAPGRADRKRKEAFIGRNYAHRGLHSEPQAVPENSEAAFTAAAEKGYGVELDVRLTGDGKAAVFHDERLSRMCGSECRVDEMHMDVLKKLPLKGTEENIPSLQEALDTIDGRIPVILDIKSGKNNALLCEKILRTMDEHMGDYCVESFDPRILRWFRKNAPDILRGQLICPAGDLKGLAPKLRAFAVSRGLVNFLGRPHFISHKLGKKSLGVRLCEALGALRFAWTSLGFGNEEGNDAVIFEGYLPRPRYK
jgi:glycerophosphoryl diester phosphodiesterase